MLEPYIKQLLVDENEVVVPEVGTFVVTHNQAEILPDSITPPRRKIQFYSKLRSDKNEKLAKLVMASEEISREDFYTQLEYFIEQVQTQIDLQGSYQLLDLGRLGRDSEGYFTFSQALKDEISEENFGLPLVHKKPLIQEYEPFQAQPAVETSAPFGGLYAPKEEEAKEEAAPFIAPLAAAQNPPATEDDFSKSSQNQQDAKDSESQTPEEPEPEEEQEEEDDEKVSSLVVWLVTIPLLAIFAFLLYLFTQPEAMSSFRNLLGMKPVTALPKEKEKTDPNVALANETAPLNAATEDQQAQGAETAQNQNPDKEAVAAQQGDATENQMQDQNQTQNQTETQTQNQAQNQQQQSTASQTASPTNPADVINEKRNVFYVVVGSFENLEYARQMQQQVGQNSRIVVYPKGGNYRVTIAERPSEREAYNERLRHLSNYPNAWVLDY